jgi:hypothetical protein
MEHNTMPLFITDPNWRPGSTRVRATAPDQYAGLRGRDYISARNLSPKVTRIQHNAADIERAVLNIAGIRNGGSHD